MGLRSSIHDLCITAMGFSNVISFSLSVSFLLIPSRSLLALQDGLEPAPASYIPFIEECNLQRAGNSNRSSSGSNLTGQRERSTSAPNVSYNVVNHDFSDFTRFKQVYSSPGRNRFPGCSRCKLLEVIFSCS